MNELQMIHRTKNIAERLVTGETGNLPYCSAAAYWQINSLYLRNAEKAQLKYSLRSHFNGKDAIEHGSYFMQPLDREVCIVYGSFCVRDRNDVSKAYDYSYNITNIMKNGIAERIILHGRRDEPVFCVIRCNENHLYMLKESEILYIESCHNDVIWHCKDFCLKSRGSLKEVEQCMPEYFLRLHRCFIVNANHIRCMEEREITVTNGDKMQIPVRNYISERDRIRKICCQWLTLPKKSERKSQPLFL